MHFGTTPAEYRDEFMKDSLQLDVMLRLTSQGRNTKGTEGSADLG